MPLEFVPQDCYAWILAAFFTGYVGKRGVRQLLSILSVGSDYYERDRDLASDRDRDSDGSGESVSRAEIDPERIESKRGTDTGRTPEHDESESERL